MSTTIIILINAVLWSAVLIAIVGGLLRAILLERRDQRGAQAAGVIAQPSGATRVRHAKPSRAYPGAARVATADGRSGR